MEADASDKVAGGLCLWRGKEIENAALFNNMAVFNNSHAVGNALNNFHLMSNYDDGNMQFSVNVLKQVKDGFYCFRIQSAGCFIGKKISGLDTMARAIPTRCF